MSPYTAQRKLYERGESNCTASVRAALITADAHRDANAYLDLFRTDLEAAAQDSDTRFRSGTARPLEGCIVAVKDNICIRGKGLTCASRILENFVSPSDATVVMRLRSAGGLLLGRTNMDEFAMGSSGEFSAFGPASHPLNPSRVPGGSSSGSAIAVATGAAMIALGSDTGGSVRQPAAFCGIVGFKPAYGALSRSGLVSFAPSCDHIGILARTVDDIVLAYSALAGTDRMDATSVDAAPIPADGEQDPGGIRVGFPREYIELPMEDSVRDAVNHFRNACVHRGLTVRDVSLPHMRYVLPAYVILTTAEASSNLARFDGVHLGKRTVGEGFAATIARSRGEGLGREVRRRIMMGAFVLSHGYRDRYYERAVRARTRIRRDFERAFSQHDVLVTPTTLTTAFALGDRREDPVRMYASDTCTASANLVGIPAISIPYGRDAHGLPIGIQLTAATGNEAALMRLSRFAEEQGRARH